MAAFLASFKLEPSMSSRANKKDGRWKILFNSRETEK